MAFVKKLKRLGKKVNKKEKRPNRQPKDVKDFDDEESDHEAEEDMKTKFKAENEKVEEEDDQDDANGWKKKKKSGGFQSMGLSPLVLKGILRRGYKVPTPIQRKTIPLILEGRDVVAMARTGSGKTAAFLIPLFEKLQVHKIGVGQAAKYPRGMILSPTRELATQTMKFFRELGKFLPLKVISILGGDSMESQFAALHEKPDVIIATPGRFMHLCIEMEFKLDGIEYIVFDEADRLFEMGFGEQLSEILKRLPENRQTVLFSATMPKLLVDFTKAGLHDPTLIRLDVDTKLSERLTLQHLACRTEDKLAVLLYLLKNLVDQRDQTIVFVATKHHVEFLHQLLEESDIPNCYIYSSLDASARKISLGKFRSCKTNVMVVTDIAARGIDIPVLDNVINFHFPAKPKLFMHRVGRVARAGRSGTAYSIIAPDDIAFLYDLHLFLGRPLNFTEDNSSENSNSTSVGRLPLDLLNEENSFVKHLMDIKFELSSMNKVSRNGYAHYLKSRPNASVESNKRAKGIEVSRLPIHPMFKSRMNVDPMESLISQMQTYRPNSTIFEIGPKAGSETQKVMKLKRVRDQMVIEKHRSGKVGIPQLFEEPSEQLGKRDEENFIHYLPKDHHTEFGLSVGATFDKQVQDSVMDLTGDDSDKLKNQRNMLKWDKKRKKYVSVGKDENAKKIKTESGTWIAASYKSNRYNVWKEKSKVEHRTVDDDSEDDNSFSQNITNVSNRKPTFSKQLVKAGKNAPKGAVEKKTQRFKSEIKRPEIILKNRKEKEKKMMQNTKKSKKGKGKGKGGGFSKGGKGKFEGGKGKGGFNKRK